MFWKFLGLAILGLFFVKFGMMSAVVPLLSGGLKLAVIVIIAILGIVIYRSFNKFS